jgi:hypothetical protein
LQKPPRAGRIRRIAKSRGWIHDLGTVARRHDQRRAHTARRDQIRSINDGRINGAVFDGSERETHAARRNQLWLKSRPQSLLLQVLLGVHAGRDCRWIPNRDAANRRAGKIASRLPIARSIRGHRDHELIGEKIDTSARHELRADDVHLRRVSADEHIDPCTGENLSRQSVGRSKVDCEALAAARLIQRRKLFENVREARGR